MFRSRTNAELNALKRQYWVQTRTQGRNRFIWKQGVLPTLLTSFVGVLAVQLFDRRHSLSDLRSIVVPAFIMLPICLLGGYLAGRWKWKDFEKKYPENGLPPWE